jgi:sulfatase maturation enzyme AslB (radical SAM superfamily)
VNCEYFGVCGGGCQLNYRESTAEQDYKCKLMELKIKHILGTIKGKRLRPHVYNIINQVDLNAMRGEMIEKYKLLG